MKALPTTSELAHLHKAMSEILKVSKGVKLQSPSVDQQKKAKDVARGAAVPPTRKP